MLFHFAKRVVGIWVSIALNLWIASGSTDILTTMLIKSPLHEHRMSFYLFLFHVYLDFIFTLYISIYFYFSQQYFTVFSIQVLILPWLNEFLSI